MSFMYNVPALFPVVRVVAIDAGNFGEKEAAVLEAIIHWNYRTISRGNDSLFGRLHHEDRSK